jgi:hypothetical protein
MSAIHDWLDSLDYHLSGGYYWLRSGRRAWMRDLAWELYTWLWRLDGYDRRLGRCARWLTWLCHYWHNGYSLAAAAAEAAAGDVCGAGRERRIHAK